jgi:flagellar biogenesis protein FliO
MENELKGNMGVIFLQLLVVLGLIVFISWHVRQQTFIEEQQLNELRITNMFLRGQVPEAKDPDRCGE